MKRIIQPELLDALPPDDPRAVRSRRDLRRVNAWMGNARLMARALAKNLAGHSPRQITELGAGDGNFMLRVAHRLGSFGASSSGELNHSAHSVTEFPAERRLAAGLSVSRRPRPVKVRRSDVPLNQIAEETFEHESKSKTHEVSATLLDLQQNVSPETLVAFAALGWRAEALVADVFDWFPRDGEIVVANLFLHHFEPAQLAGLLRSIARRASLFIALEPRRAAGPLFCSRLLWAIGCNDVTRHDAVVSVRAGFAGNELSTLWPDPNQWRITERSAGPFSHLFIAQKPAAGILPVENPFAGKMSAAPF